MLIEDLQPFFEAQPSDYDRPGTFYLTINKTRVNNTWSAGYQDYATGKVLLGINNCDSLDEVALRLNGRLMRYIRRNLKPPRTLHDQQNRDMVSSTNITEECFMANEQPTPNTASNEQQLTFGQKAVGLSFNPSNNPKVQDLKEKAAAFIDACNEMRRATDTTKPDSEVARMASVAITEAQTAQMWAVKAATWQA